MGNQISPEKVSSFLEEVLQESNVNIRACFQCQKCSAGCPVVSAMDIMPHQIIRQIQYGRKDKVLSSRTIWICASCHTCSTRCPNDIDVAKVMDSLRHLSLRYNYKTPEEEIPLFHRVFLENIKSSGRVHELSLIMRYKLKTKDFFKDATLGWEMFRRGKIKIMPAGSYGTKDVKKIFQVYEKGERR